MTRPLQSRSSDVPFRFGDALRTIAIVFVVLSHIAMVVPFLRNLEPYRIALGSWGVDAFFVLSGFLLGRPYVDSLLGRLPLPNWKRYARRRFLRIWPAYAVVVLLAFAKSTLHHGANSFVTADTLTHLLMIHNFFPPFAGGAENIALWTMAVDAQFYVVLPIGAWFLYQRRDGNNSRHILVALGSAALISIIWRLTIPLFVPETTELVLSVERNLVGMGTSFAVGIFLAYLGARGIGCSVNTARRLIIAAIALTVAEFALDALASPTAIYKDFGLDILGTLSTGALVYATPYVAWPILDVFLKSRFVEVAAANAYALYLLHVPIKQTVDAFLTGHQIAEETARYGLFFSIGFCACCAVAVPLLHRFVEVPFLTLKERSREIAVAN